MYTRKFLGDFQDINYLLDRTGIDYSDLAKYSDKVSYEIPQTEEAFLNWLNEKNERTGGNEKPSKYGYLWAYQKASHDPKILKLFQDGKKFLSLTRTNEKVTIKNLKSVLGSLGRNLFDLLYRSEASYRE